MGASTDAQIHEFIAQKVRFYKAALKKQTKSTSEFALSEVQETDSGGSLHLTGTNKHASANVQKHLASQTQRVRQFPDSDSASKKWVWRNDEESEHRPRHGRDFVEASESVAVLSRCNDIPEGQPNQLQQTDCDMLTGLAFPASQPESVVLSSPTESELAAGWPRLQPEIIPPGMKEPYANSDGSCETIDSSDYSSGTEDCQDVARALRKRPFQEATKPFENRSEDAVAKVQKGHVSTCFQRPKELIVAKRNEQQNSNETSIITIESDSEEEYVVSSKMTSSGLENSGDADCVAQKRQNRLLTDIIVIDSDTEDEGDQSIEKSTMERLSSVGEDGVVLVIPRQLDHSKNKTATNVLTSSDAQSKSEHQNTPQDAPKDKAEAASLDPLNRTEPTASKDVWNKVENKSSNTATFERTKNSPPLCESVDDSRQSTWSLSKYQDPKQTPFQSEKLEISAKALPHETASVQPAHFSTTGLQKTNASEKSQLWFGGNSKGEYLSKWKIGNSPKPDFDRGVEQQVAQSSTFSLTAKGDSSIPISTSVSSSRGNCEVRDASPPTELSSQSAEPTTTNCNRRKLKRVAFAPTQHSRLKRLVRSTSAPSMSGTSATSPTSPTTAPGHQIIPTTALSPSMATKSLPRMKVLEEWTKTHYPIRIEKKYHLGVEQNTEPTNHTVETANHTFRTDSQEPVHPDVVLNTEVPRQRRRSQDSNTRLMKRCKNEAVMWSKAINRQPAQNKKSTVGVGYKWAEKPSATK